jgi:hypothetical protein
VTAARVYFVEAGPGGPIKIGTSLDVASRLRDLQATCPETLRLIVAIPGGHEDEHRLHCRFADERLHHEWFRGDGAVRSFALSLASANLETVIEMTRPVKSARRRLLRSREPKPKRLTLDEYRALFFVGEGSDIYRSADAEAVLLRAEKRRRPY